MLQRLSADFLDIDPAMKQKDLRITAGLAGWPRYLALLGFVFAVSACFVKLGVAAERTPQEVKSPAAVPAAQDKSSKKETQRPPGVPPLRNLLIMIRTTLVALYQANLTNNYSVLRDLSAPSFQQANSTEQLSAAFANLRARGGDMAPVVLALPTLSEPAAIDRNGMLRLKGAFDTRPNELAFDLVFQVVDGFWRLDGIAVQFRPPLTTKVGEAVPPKAGGSSAESEPKKKVRKKALH